SRHAHTHTHTHTHAHAHTHTQMARYIKSIREEPHTAVLPEASEVCVYVCVCERERERERRLTLRHSALSLPGRVCACVCVCACLKRSPIKTDGNYVCVREVMYRWRSMPIYCMFSVRS